MNKRVALSELSTLIEESLQRGGEAIFAITGSSMQPMLYHRRDKVRLVKPNAPLKKYDLVLFVRDDGKYVLHRIVGEGSEGYVVIGDNQTFKEYPVKESQVAGVVTGFWRNGNYISCNQPCYLLYCKIWVAFYPVRYIWRRKDRILPKMLKLFRRKQG